MSSRTLQITNTDSLFAAVWIASALAAWAVMPDPDEFGDDPFLIFFFRFVPMVTVIGALFGRPKFGVAVGIATLVSLAGIEMASVLMGVV